MARKRPDAKIVGDDLHPIGQVKDFAPYVAKIKQSGADTIVTGNWGQDLTLLIKALNDSGLKVPMYTYYAGVTGTPTALAAGRRARGLPDRLQPLQLHRRAGRNLMADFKKKFNDDFYTFSIYNGIVLLGEAMAKAKSTDPVKVAAAMEGLKFKGFNGDVEMRKTDHQMQQGLWISKWQKVDAKNTYSVENTGYTFAPVKYMEPYVASTPTSCQMKRPSGFADPRSRRGATVTAGVFLSDPKRLQRHGVLHHFAAERPELRAAAVHAELGPDADLQHDGRAQFRARQLLHAGRLLRLQRSPAWSASGRRWSSRRCWWPARRLFERYCLRRVHKFGHVPELLITFGLSYVILELVQLVWGRSSAD